MKKNAFTLVELLAVLVIIGILSAISIAIYTNSISESKNSLSEFQKKQLIDSARTYVAVNTIGFNNIFDNMTVGETSSCVALQIRVLSIEGLIGQNVIDPKDTRVELNGHIKIKYNSQMSQYEYEYVGEDTLNSVCKYRYVVENDEVKQQIKE